MQLTSCQTLVSCHIRRSNDGKSLGCPNLPPCTAVLRREYSKSSCIVQRPGNFTSDPRLVTKPDKSHFQLHSSSFIHISYYFIPESINFWILFSSHLSSLHKVLMSFDASIFFLVNGSFTRLVLRCKKMSTTNRGRFFGRWLMLATSLAFLSYLLPLQHCHREKARKVGLIKSTQNVKANGRSTKWDTQCAFSKHFWALN